MKTLMLLLALLPVLVQASTFYEADDGGSPTHLTPVGQRDPAYEKRLRQHLFVSDGSLARLLVRPSFSPESSLAVDVRIPEELVRKYGDRRLVPDHEQQYFITVSEARDSLWYSMASNTDDGRERVVEVERSERRISLELAIAIQRAWGRMLQLTRYPAHVSIGLDGTTYQFFTWVRGLGHLQGQTWSPDEGFPAEMVALAQSLRDFTVDQVGNEAELIARLQDFESRLPKPQP